MKTELENSEESQRTSVTIAQNEKYLLLVLQHWEQKI